jgi:nicotinamide riboside transporter PnuC
VSLVLSLTTSLMTLTGMWLVGAKRSSGWLIGIVNQALWVALIIDTRAWGLLLLTGALLVIYGRNLYLWSGPRCDQAGPCNPRGRLHRRSCPGRTSHPEYVRGSA